ncbi:MAG: hypothetical protein ABF289_15215 [Clostridiales bacterium]
MIIYIIWISKANSYLSKRIRPFFNYNRKLLSKLSKCAWKVLSSYLKESVSLKKPVPGVVVSIQTFGDFINFNPHLHIIATDGCWFNIEIHDKILS